MLMRLSILLAISAAAPTAAAADSDRGACARLSALLEVADLAEGFEDVPAIARSGDDAACARALQRLGIGAARTQAPDTKQSAPRECDRKDDG